MNTNTQTLFLCTTHTKTTENMLMKHTYCEVQGNLGEPGIRFKVTALLIKYTHFNAVRNAAISILMTPVHYMKQRKCENRRK